MKPPRLSKAVIDREISCILGINYEEVKVISNAFFEYIKENKIPEKQIAITNFGIFYWHKINERKGFDLYRMEHKIKPATIILKFEERPIKFSKIKNRITKEQIDEIVAKKLYVNVDIVSEITKIFFMMIKLSKEDLARIPIPLFGTFYWYQMRERGGYDVARRERHIRKASKVLKFVRTSIKTIKFNEIKQQLELLKKGR